MKKQSKIVLLFIVIAIFSPRIFTALKSLNPFIESIKVMYLNRNTTYLERFTLKYPLTVPLVDKIKQNTPEDAVIYLPSAVKRYSENYWPLPSKNNMYAFIYPRKVVKEEEVGSFKIINQKPTYIIIFENYPNEKINASEIIIFSSTEDQKSYQEYDPIKFSNEIGLIKL